MKFLLLGVVSLLAKIGFCEIPPKWIIDSQSVGQSEEWGYLRPNELEAQRIVPLMKNAPVGAYVGVGADRVFNYAGLSPNINRIVCIDSDPSIVNFNLFNIFLLQASKNMKDYKHLRLEASWPELSQRLSAISSKLHPKVAAAVNESNLLEIRQAFQEGGIWGTLHHPSTHDTGFSQVNYMNNPEQFARIKMLADTGMIEAHLANLKDSRFTQKLIRSLQGQLSIFDISNAWGDRYVGKERTKKMLKGLKETNPEAYFLYTSLTPGSDTFDFHYGMLKLDDLSLLERAVLNPKVPKFGLINNETLAAMKSRRACKNSLHGDE